VCVLLSMVFPARNEAGNVRALVAEAVAVAVRLEREQLVGGVEIIVVDDASTDETATLALSVGDPRVRVVRNEHSRGYGAALRAGFAAATGSLLAFSDADLQFDLSDLPRLIRARAVADVVCGYRVDRRDPLGRRLAGWMWSRAVGVALGVRVRDVNCAFKVFPRELVASPPLTQDGAAINAELLLRARHRGCRVVELPVRHRERQAGRASGGNVDVALRAWRELYALRSQR
jgi:glycosyltransferase involved in cell wall biosynthesis